MRLVATRILVSRSTMRPWVRDISVWTWSTAWARTVAWACRARTVCSSVAIRAMRARTLDSAAFSRLWVSARTGATASTANSREAERARVARKP